MKRYFTCALAILCLLSSVAPVFAKPPKRHAPVKNTSAAREAAESRPRFAIDPDGGLIPDLHAAAGIVYDPVTDEVLWALNADTPRSIASITKVMTATVVLDSEPDLSSVVTIQHSDVFAANHTYLRQNDKVTVDDLLHMLLIGSDNAAARALARVSPYGKAGFIDKMNEKAVELGLENTSYTDPSGLLRDNISTAFDMAKLIAGAGSDDYIGAAMQFTTYTVHAAKRLIAVRTTDHLLTHTAIQVKGAKTGFTNPAGYCLASSLQVGERVLSIVVLGARSNVERFAEVENLYKWAQLKLAGMDIHTPNAGTVSEQGAVFLKGVEGFRPKPYLDSSGQWAVGYGMHYWNGQKVTRRFPVGISSADADAEFIDQIARFDAMVPPVPSQEAHDALVSIAYNLGHINASILEKLSARQPVTPDDFLVTATVHGRPFAGLITRRLREFAVMAGDYRGSMLTK